MCGRYTLKTEPDSWGQLLLPIVEASGQDASSSKPKSEKLSAEWKAEWQPRFNIAPTQNVFAVRNDREGEMLLDYFRWGLVPSWAKELSIGSRMINARAETLPEKKSFSGPLKSRRCLVVADGYYEWQRLDDGGKQACWISPAEGGVMCLAGLWEANSKATGEPVQTCTIITTAANQSLGEIHDRMPVVIDGQALEQWMSPKTSGEVAHELLGSADEDYFRVTRVSNFVNRVRNDSPECIEPQEESK